MPHKVTTHSYRNLGLAPPKLGAPFPSWDIQDIQIIEIAIGFAWKLLLNDQDARTLIKSGKEVEISNKLQDAIEQILNEELIDGFSPAVFSPPIRGQELEDYSGRRLEKRPDLTFQRHGTLPCTRHHALFFECKLIGRGRTVKDYVRDGLERFCDGRYAWAMPHAGLIAYFVGVNGSADPATALATYWINTTPDDPTIPALPLRPEVCTELTMVTTLHQRSFVLQNARQPGPISLRHLWLQDV